MVSHGLGISIDDQHDASLLLDLARRHVLTVYDATYPEVDLGRGLPLATLDGRQSEAPEVNCVAVIQHHTSASQDGTMGLDQLTGCTDLLNKRM